MIIAECAVGTEVRLTGSTLDDSHGFRLRELGLGTGTRARIVQRAPFGGRVLSIGGQRIAVDGHTARRLAVEVLSHATTTQAAPAAVTA